jgi:trans-aconitate 2-methyltransferase
MTMAGWNGSHYDEVSAPQFRWGVEILARLGDLGPGTVLDAGCGSGRVTEVLLGTSPQISVVALDASASMLEQARCRLARFEGRVSYAQGDLDGDIAGALLSSDPFDAVLSTGTFHWVKDPAGMYKKLFDLLVSGGRLVAQCGGAGSVAAVRRILDEIGVAWSALTRYANDAETATWLADAGFVDVWTWLSDEPVEFADQESLVDYLLGGVLAPYVGDRQAEEQRRISERVASGLDELILRFVRLNILARRP